MKTSVGKILLATLLVQFTLGCASLYQRNPLSPETMDLAQIKDIDNARFWGDQVPPTAKGWLEQSKQQIKAELPGVFGRPHHYLAISGGGANGAFTAGLLSGWTQAGDRPEFTIVSGISTGALIAPFAFLGSDYDDLLKEVYTSHSTDDLVKERFILTALTGDAILSSEPLKELIAEFCTQQLIDAIAVEYRKGRRLYIGTTNLDADRPVIWRIGKIAASGSPDSLELIRKILLASASIPGAFPPVYIDVEVNGKKYDEIHVDGGAASQVFLYPVELNWSQILEKLEVPEMPHLYIIRNSRIEPRWKVVEPKLISITGRSINSMIRTQGIGDIYRIYLGAIRDGIDYNLAYIPGHFDAEQKELFDKEYMNELVDLGFQMAISGYPWSKTPPGFEKD